MRLNVYYLFLALIILLNAAPANAGRRVIVGLPPNPPLSFTDSDGRPSGIAVDILSHIARQANWTVDYLAGSSSECIRRLESGTIDLLPGMVMTRRLEDRLAFGKEAVITDWGQLYITPEESFSGILDLHGKKIAVVGTDRYYRYLAATLDKFGIRPRFVRVGDYGAVLSMVDRDRVSAGVVSRLYGAVHEKRLRVRKSLLSFRPTKLRFAVTRSRNADILTILDGSLKALKANPDSIYYRSLDRWTRDARKPAFPSWIKPLWVLGVTLAFMGLILVGNVILRRQVRLRTGALKETIAEKEKIESELAVAREIQLQLVPDNSLPVPRRKEFDIYASLEPAREVGGDFYDYFFIDRDTLCLVIGDVSGKGVPAALFMAMTKTMLKSAARLLVEPEYILADVNREIAGNNPSLTFVTVFIGVLDLNTGRLTYASAGHNPPLFIGRKGNSVLLGDAQCPAVGLDDTFQYRQASVQLRHREGLLLFTDGVIEAMDGETRPFTQEALMSTVSLTAGLTPRERVEAVLSRVREFTANRPLEDDLTLLALTYFSPYQIGDTLKTIVLKNDITEMNRITDTITKIAQSADCPQVVVHDVILAIEEIFSNIVFYGFGDGMNHNITFHVVAEADALILTLQDEGIPFKPLNVRVGSEDKPLEERHKGGMGIILAKNLMDRMEYRRERGRNILRMEKHYR